MDTWGKIIPGEVKGLLQLLSLLNTTGQIASLQATKSLKVKQISPMSSQSSPAVHSTRILLPELSSRSTFMTTLQRLILQAGDKMQNQCRRSLAVGPSD